MNKNSPNLQHVQSKLGRREYERIVHRQTMLEAAERVFARKGFREATLGEIAQEADFGVGTFYNFFKSKEDLYTQVLAGIVLRFMTEFERDVQKRDNPTEALSALIDLRLRFFTQHREFFRFFFEQSVAGVSLTKDHLKFRIQYQKVVSHIFASGIQRGIFDPMDPLYAAICLDGMLNAIVRYWSTLSAREPPATQVKEIKRSVLDRFLHRE